MIAESRGFCNRPSARAAEAGAAGAEGAVCCEGCGWKYITTFKEQKHSGFGLRHRFVNATNANKVWYDLMQIAWTLWQMFQPGFLLPVWASPMRQIVSCA